MKSFSCVSIKPWLTGPQGSTAVGPLKAEETTNHPTTGRTLLFSASYKFTHLNMASCQQFSFLMQHMLSLLKTICLLFKRKIKPSYEGCVTFSLLGPNIDLSLIPYRKFVFCYMNEEDDILSEGAIRVIFTRSVFGERKVQHSCRGTQVETKQMSAGAASMCDRGASDIYAGCAA